MTSIITYQVTTGNYSDENITPLTINIITYQVITRNYSYNVLWEFSDNILKNINGKETLVTYVQSKHHDLRIQTMYSGKRKSLAITPSDVDIFSQTSKTLNGTAFKNIISQSQKNNTLNKRDHI